MVGTLAVPEGSERRPASSCATRVPASTTTPANIAVRLAELDYVAFALDYHGDGRPIADRQQMMARIGELRADPLRAAIGTAGLDVLRAEARTDPDRLAAIGFCFGGTVSLELARGGADLKAAVGFHAGLGTVRPQDARDIRAKVLALIGADDPMVTSADRLAFEEEMRAGGVDWVLTVYGGAEHSFTRPGVDGSGVPGVRYDEATDRRSWRAMLNLLDEVFG